MEPESLILSLGAQAIAALTVLTMTRYALPGPDRIPATLRPAVERTGGGQLWNHMKRRCLPAVGNAG